MSDETILPPPDDIAAQLAKHIAAVDVEAFAWLLGLEFTHGEEAQDAKDMIVGALSRLNRVRELEADNEGLKVGIAFGNDLLPALQERIHELEAQRDAAKINIRSVLLRAEKIEAERDAIRAKTIEECAQVIQEDFDRPDMAEAIRALAHADEDGK